MLNQIILITGASGFIGLNVVRQLSDKFPLVKFIETNSTTNDEDLENGVRQCDLIFHFAGANRPEDGDFNTANEDLTAKLCRLSALYGGKDIIFTSSTHAISDSNYGISKKNCELILTNYRRKVNKQVHILRLPGVFGKWSKPNYNSDISLDDNDTLLPLLYIDDFVKALEQYLACGYGDIKITHYIKKIKLKNLVSILRAFRLGPHKCFDFIDDLYLDKKLIKNLHSTYVSFMPDETLNFRLDEHEDDRGIFCEIMREIHFGQLSFASLLPGAIRGGHYHHSKVELFVVVHGDIQFSQKDVLTLENVDFNLSGKTPSAIYTKPGSMHSLQNVTHKPAVIAIWTNEKFEKEFHDTYFIKEKQ